MIEHAISKVNQQLEDKVEYFVRDTVGIHFAQTVAVEIRKPTWMPEWLYRRLMRTIVVKRGELKVGR